MGEALALIAQGFTAVTTFFANLWNAIPGAKPVYLAAVIIVLSVRLILLPIVSANSAAGASDVVRKRRDN